MTLGDLAKGAEAVVTEIVHDEEGHWRKLATFGLMPGATVKMVQKWPTLVVRVGRTEVGLDQTTSRLVRLADSESAPAR